MTQIAADTLGLPLGQVRVFHGSTPFLDEGYGAFASRSTVLGGSAVFEGARALLEKIRAAAAARLGVAAEQIELVDGRARAGDGRSLAFAELASGRAAGRRHLRQRQQADLHLWIGGGACGGRPGDRACRAAGLSRRRGCRPHRQSIDLARPGNRRRGPGARRRLPGKPCLRRQRAVVGRQSRRLPDPDRNRFSPHSGDRPGKPPVAGQPARRQGRRRGRDNPDGRPDGQRRRQRLGRGSGRCRTSCRSHPRGSGGWAKGSRFRVQRTDGAAARLPTGESMGDPTASRIAQDHPYRHGCVLRVGRTAGQSGAARQAGRRRRIARPAASSRRRATKPESSACTRRCRRSWPSENARS